MVTPKISDTEFLELLDKNWTDEQIAEKGKQTVRGVSRRKLKLAAMRAGAAVRASSEIVRKGLDHAAGYLMIGMTLLERIDALATEAEGLDENRTALADMVTLIAAEHGEEELFSPAFSQMLIKATQPRDPDPLLIKAIEAYQKNIALYADIYEKMANVRIISQLKELILSLLDIDDPTVRAAIESRIMQADASRGILGVDRYHPEPDRTVWNDEDEAVFAALPLPRDLPAARA